MSYDRFLQCDYLDSQLQPASLMLNRCVQDPSKGVDMSCTDHAYMKENMMNTLAVQRGHEEGIESQDSGFLKYAKHGSHNVTYPIHSQERTGTPDISGGVEGFANRNRFITDNGPGESTVPNGECPEGYSKCLKTGRCIQVCIGCKYRDNMRSQEFNEYDPCFPNGVFDGYSNSGDIKFTCGLNNQYSSKKFSNNFGADGTYLHNHKFVGAVGLTDKISKLFAFTSL